MSKSLVIVESPNKVRTINKYLGDEFIVTSSIGHICDLVEKSGTSARGKRLSPEEKLDLSLVKMGIDPNNWKGNYEVLPDKTKVVNELKALAKQCDTIYLATDLDREGEAIAWNLTQVLGDKHEYKRVIFNEITAKAIKNAFKKPTHLNLDLVHAQQTRRYLDRMVGFLISPLLWKKAGRGLSAGRVQSVAMRLIVEREREIRKFIPVEYWKMSSLNNDFEFELTHIDGQRLTSPEDENPFFIANEEQALYHEQKVNTAAAVVSNVEVKNTKSSPKAPFTTSTLQQTASTALGFSVRRTMIAAQALYELGLITYMRTDSTNLSADAVEMAVEYIEDKYGKEYVNTERTYNSNNANAQEAHEAIRPTNVKSIIRLSSQDQLKLYNLIKSRFLASQMEDAVYQNTSVSLTVNNEHVYTFKGSKKQLKFAGHLKAFGRQEEILVDQTAGLEVDDLLDISATSEQNFTKPPARFTEASLVNELEKKSIGRPSTYASIISTIQDRGYAHIVDKKFHASTIAEIVNDSLEYSFPNIMDYGFTANMEGDLDKIANGEKVWTKELDAWWKDLRASIIQASLPQAEGGMRKKSAIPTDYTCPVCKERKMNLQITKSGMFLSCEGYDKSEKKCKGTLSFIPKNQVQELLGEDYEPEVRRCPKCDSLMMEYFINMSTKIFICSNIAVCDHTEIVTGNFLPEKFSNINCDECGSHMEYKFGPYSKYLQCTGCGATRKVLADGSPAPASSKRIDFPELKTAKGDSYFVLRNSNRGIFFGAASFPKNRETSMVTVEILAKYRDRLPEELQYLADGPQEDHEGKKTVVRYSIKDQEQFIASPGLLASAKFKAYYEDGKWVSNLDELLAEADAKAASEAAKESQSKTSKAKSTRKTKSTTAKAKAETKTKTASKAKATSKTKAKTAGKTTTTRRKKATEVVEE